MKLKSRPCRRKSRHQDFDTKARPDWHSNTKTPLEVTRNIAFQLNSLNPNFLVTIMTQGRMMIDLSELVQRKYENMQQSVQNLIKEIQIIKLWFQMHLKSAKYRKRRKQCKNQSHFKAKIFSSILNYFL